MVRFFRSVRRSIHLATIFLFGALDLIVTRPSTREQRARWLQRFAMRGLRRMGIVTSIHGTFPPRGVLISNHLGYLDIVVLAAQHECVFVSKAELADVPVLGWMTNMAGTIYVERGRGGSAQRARGGMQAVADAGLPIVIFPEGTTSNGTTILKFHSGLLTQAVDTGQSITAAFISYRLTEDNGPGRTIQNDVCYWGDDVGLFRHIFNLLSLRGIEVDVRIADHPIAFTSDTLHRKQLAEEARAAVMELGDIQKPVIAAIS